MVSCFFETFPAGGGWLENPILIKTQLSAGTWTWTLGFDLGFVEMTFFQENELGLNRAMID